MSSEIGSLGTPETRIVPLNPPPHEASTQEGVEGFFPNEIWERILMYANFTATWKDILNYTLVSKQFRSLCLTSIMRYRMFLTLKRLDLPKGMPVVPAQAVTQLGDGQYIIGASEYITLASQRTEQGERRFMRSLQDQSVLFILNFSSDRFEWASLNIKPIHREKFESIRRARGLVENNHWSKIVNCHPTEEGFILVTAGGVSIWNYNKTSQLPECSALYSPLDNTQGSRVQTCNYSTYHKGILYVTSIYDPHDSSPFSKDPDENAHFWMIDLTQEAPKFIALPLYESSNFRIHQTPEGELLLLRVFRESSRHVKFLFQKTKVQKSYSTEIIEKPFLGKVLQHTSNYNLEPTQTSVLENEFGATLLHTRMENNWLVFATHDAKNSGYLLRIFDSNTFSCWGENLKLKYPDPDLNEYLFFVGDFLFLSYSDGSLPRVIHLPTKKEYTDKLTFLLKPYLIKNYRLAGLNWHRSHCQILLQTESSTGTILESIKIAINLSNNDPFTIEIDAAQESKEKTPSSSEVREEKGKAPQIQVSETLAQNPNEPHSVTLAEIDRDLSQLNTIFSEVGNLVEEQSTHLDQAELRLQNLQSSEPKVSVIHSTSLCKTLDGRIVIIAGVALVLVALAATLALVFTHPGTILVQHHSFVLTVPTVVTFAAGEGVALIVIAFGIYFCKQRAAG